MPTCSRTGVPTSCCLHSHQTRPALVFSQALPQHVARRFRKADAFERRRRIARTDRAVHAARLVVRAAVDPVVANSSSEITTSGCAATMLFSARIEADESCALLAAWRWEKYNIRVQQCGSSGPVLVCVHGFGGNW